ncbi:MAG: hypothetical protein HFE48_06130 [Clostridia bacterium]|nr:hypothetical protein [Clostridia bacterium]
MITYNGTNTLTARYGAAKRIAYESRRQERGVKDEYFEGTQTGVEKRGGRERGEADRRLA